MTGRLAGKVALVTGAASGIGAATVELMLREGARVLATDIDADRGEALRAKLAAHSEHRIAFAERDVTQERDWESAIAFAAERLGPLDVLVNNAGVIPAIVPLAQTGLDEWRRVMAVNLDGAFLGVKHAIRAMTGRGGAIVNVSSAAALVGMPLNGAYGAAKAGVLMLTKCAALECAQLDPPIRVNAVHPGYIATGMTEAISDTLGSERFQRRVRKAVPLRRLGEPADIAEAIVFLACDQSKFATGSSVVVDGGWTAQ